MKEEKREMVHRDEELQSKLASTRLEYAALAG